MKGLKTAAELKQEWQRQLRWVAPFFVRTNEAVSLPLRAWGLCVMAATIAVGFLYLLVYLSVSERFDVYLSTINRTGLYGMGAFSAITTTLLLLVVNYQWLLRHNTRLTELVRRRQTPSTELVHQAIDELSRFPITETLISLFVWFFAAGLWYLGFSHFAELPAPLVRFIAIGVACEGLLLAPYQYFFFRMMVAYDYDKISGLLDEPYYPEKIRLVTMQRKIAGSILVLLVASLVAFFFTTRYLSIWNLQGRTVEVGRDLLTASAFSVSGTLGESGLFAGMDYDTFRIDEARRLIDTMDRATNQPLFLVDRNGSFLFGDPRRLPRGLSQKMTAVLKADENLETRPGDWIEDRQTLDMLVAVRVRDLKTDNWTGHYVVTFYLFDDIERSLDRTAWIALFVIVVMVIVGLQVSLLGATDFTTPVGRMNDIAASVADGDLTRELQVLSEDEIGSLGKSFSSMLGTIQHTLRRVGRSADEVDQVIGQISAVADRVSKGGSSQIVSVREASQHLDLLHNSIRSIGENVSVLNESAEESSSSVSQMSLQVTTINQNVVKLSESVEETSTAIEEMLRSIEQVGGSVGRLKGISSDSTNALEKLNGLISKVEANAKSTDELARQTARHARTGTKSVDDMIAGIETIRTSFTQMQHVIESLHESASDIGNILGVIRDIADRTNLLSLNASIIAAQAGEHGKGFSVVANEILSLANSTATNTRDIERRIETLQSESQKAIKAVEQGSEAIGRGLSLSHDAGAALKEIAASAEQSAAMVKLIVTTTNEQSAEASNVSRAFDEVAAMVSQISRATQEQTHGTGRISNATVEMRDVASAVSALLGEHRHHSAQIVGAMKNITEMIHYISEAQNQETATCDEVQKLVTEIVRVSEIYAGEASTLNESILTLQKLSNTLREELSRFVLSPGGNGAAAPASGPGEPPRPGTPAIH
ncbi:MAG: HAMP domain-containing protein [Deltaproteobacteria bacterium]|nr:HAMP domain-containing protein [Deltaproteobacteria bacterium]